MNKLKVSASFVVSLLLVFSIAFSAAAAPAVSSKDVTTGRTQLKVNTGVITVNSVEVPRYASDVRLSGTVTIDGPSLVLKVNGVDVTNSANVLKTADKTWTYDYTASLNNKVGNVGFEINAYTIYPNGKPTTDIHTSAAPVTQIVHVPYVTGFDFVNAAWGSYNRLANTFLFSYNLVKIWDDGTREAVDQKVTASVEGTGVYSIEASDRTHNNGAVTVVAVVTPPVTVRNFTADEGRFDNYNRANNTYTLTFNLTKELSNGTSEPALPLTFSVEAGKTFAYTAVDTRAPGYSVTFTFTAPPAPKEETPVVKEVLVTVTGQERLAKNDNQNNYKVTYDLTVKLSNNKEYTLKGYEETVPYNNGNTTGSKEVVKTFNLDGTDYTTSYTVTVNVN